MTSHKSTNKVVVLGTGVVAYGVIYEAAHAGCTVIHVTTKPHDIAALSRFVTQVVVVDSGVQKPDELLDVLLRISDECCDALLVPVNDPAVVFVSKNLEALSSKFSCSVQPWKIHREIINKNRLYRTAHEIGVPAPVVHDVDAVEDLHRFADSIVYPCLIKPHQTPDFFRIFGRKVHVIRDRDELIHELQRTLQHELKVMISELVPGPEENLYIYSSCLDERGNVLMEGLTRKVRQNTDFGVASVIGTVDAIPAIRESCLRLLRHFRYRGFSCVEVKWDEDAQVHKLIEINSRPVLYQRIFAKAGVNITALLFDDLVLDSRAAPVYTKPGIFWMHNISEMYALKRHMMAPDLRLRDFFPPYRSPHVYALPAFEDPLPLFASLRKMFSRH